MTDEPVIPNDDRPGNLDLCSETKTEANKMSYLNPPMIKINDLVAFEVNAEGGIMRLVGEVLGWVDPWKIEVLAIFDDEEAWRWDDETLDYEYLDTEEMTIDARSAKVIGVVNHDH